MTVMTRTSSIRKADAYRARRLPYFFKHEYDRAIADCDDAIKLNPKDAKSYYVRGLAYHLKGEYDRAIADFDQTIKLDPKYTDAYTYQAAAYQARTRARCGLVAEAVSLSRSAQPLSASEEG